ncbi:hypothetical protein [Pseudaestuariivita atlantica]|uniref:Uncharacterized protein n=1 Tax=Pseudaestuariivita atlantica TaxID=1317121 RepID=A0A0L1JNP6_9RHOB|nr:hypothetical protein [Pseudaestuariivita atlantica]KNG93381.1 hypothetical protein ATO11_13185 [Pseudaestuariivita atlantica]
MTDMRGPYAPAALFIALSGVLHLVALPFGAWEAFGLIFVAIAVFYAALAWGLVQGWRWVAWLAFFCMLIGGIGAFSETFARIPAWPHWAILLADASAAVLLFRALWWPAHTV